MILTRADIPIADEELAARFLGLSSSEALLLAQAELVARSARPQNKNLRNLKTLVRQMERLEEPETKVWLEGLRVQEDAGSRLTMGQRIEILRWLSSLAVLSKYRHGTHARCEPITRPRCVVGHVGAIQGQFDDYERIGPQPGSRRFTNLMAYACGCRVFRVVVASQVSSQVFAGRVGAIPLGSEPQFESDILWRLTFDDSGSRDGPRGRSCVVPSECLEPATVDDLEREILKPRRYEDWDTLFGRLGGYDDLHARDLWTGVAHTGSQQDRQLRATTTAKLDVFLREVEAAEAAVACRSDWRATADAARPLKASMEGVGVYPGHDDLVARYQQLRRRADACQK